MNRDDIRFCLAVSRRGSLAGAPEDLAVSPITAGRRLGAPEEALGVQLLPGSKSPEGYVLTRAGPHVHDQVERAERAVLGVPRAAPAHDDKLSGLVRPTCAEIVARLRQVDVPLSRGRAVAKRPFHVLSVGGRVILNGIIAFNRVPGRYNAIT